MSLTFTQLATQSLRDIGCLRPGQQTSTDVLADCLTAGNQLLDGFLIDKLLVYTISIAAYTLTAAKQSYTIGPAESAPNFTAARPTRIEEANLILNTVTPVVRLPMQLLDDSQWAAIRVQQIPSAIPLKLYYDGGYSQTTGAATIYLWPGPLANYQLELFTWQQLQEFADLTTSYIFPPGYARLMRKALGVEIAPMMRMYAKVPGPGGIRGYDPQMLALVIAQADQARMDVEAYNAPAPVAISDPMFGGGAARRTAWNYAIGEYGSSGRP